MARGPDRFRDDPGAMPDPQGRRDLVEQLARRAAKQVSGEGSHPGRAPVAAKTYRPNQALHGTRPRDWFPALHRDWGLLVAVPAGPASLCVPEARFGRID